MSFCARRRVFGQQAFFRQSLLLTTTAHVVGGSRIPPFVELCLVFALGQVSTPGYVPMIYPGVGYVSRVAPFQPGLPVNIYTESDFNSPAYRHWNGFETGKWDLPDEQWRRVRKNRQTA